MKPCFGTGPQSQARKAPQDVLKYLVSAPSPNSFNVRSRRCLRPEVWAPIGTILGPSRGEDGTSPSAHRHAHKVAGFGRPKDLGPDDCWPSGEQILAGTPVELAPRTCIVMTAMIGEDAREGQQENRQGMERCAALAPRRSRAKRGWALPTESVLAQVSPAAEHLIFTLYRRHYQRQIVPASRVFLAPTTTAGDVGRGC